MFQSISLLRIRPGDSSNAPLPVRQQSAPSAPLVPTSSCKSLFTAESKYESQINQCRRANGIRRNVRGVRVSATKVGGGWGIKSQMRVVVCESRRKDFQTDCSESAVWKLVVVSASEVDDAKLCRTGPPSPFALACSCSDELGVDAPEWSSSCGSDGESLGW